MRLHILHLSALASTGFGFQLPFNVPFFRQDSKLQAPESNYGLSNSSLPRIAIIGAGAGGSSAAFWIAKAKERFGLDVEIEVYEKAQYVGGRSTVVYPYGNTSLPAVELGGSVFVAANKNLWRASDEFNLTRLDAIEEGGSTGIWDGENIIFEYGDGWWDLVKLMWRYGILSPKRTDSLVQDMIKRILTLYERDTLKWDEITELSDALEFTSLTQNSTLEYFVKQGISEKFVSEVMEAATRVNYGQDREEIHALGGAVSMAAEKVSSIEGGNFQIFENFLKRAGATIHLNTTVTSIKHATNGWRLQSDKGAVDYNAVILAAPFHGSGIELPSALSAQIPEQPYVHLHVTLLSTTSPRFNPGYFARPAGYQPPLMMLTTDQGVRDGGKKPEINSISYHGLVREGEWVVKIFSKERISGEWLEKMFPGNVGWVHRKEWDAYPKLTPTATFPPVKLDKAFYYVNAFEPFISTMETETISSRNVVDLLMKDEFDAGICGPPGAVGNGTDNDKEFIYGWDC